MIDPSEEEPIQAIIDAALKAKTDGHSSECIMATLISVANAIAIVASGGDHNAGAELFLAIHKALARNDADEEDTVH